MSLSVNEAVYTEDAFLAIEDLVDEFEQQLAAGQSSQLDLETLFADWLFQYEADLSKEQIESGAIEMLRVWLEVQSTRGAEPTVSEALSHLPEVEFSARSIEVLHYELQRLRASDQEEASRSIDYPEVGEKWNGFELLGVLGQGAISRVFLARQTAMSNRVVALKLTPRETSESHLLARIQHSGVVPIFSVHHQDGLYGVCMPYMGSTTLSDLLEAKESDLTTDSLNASSNSRTTIPQTHLGSVLTSGKSVAAHLLKNQSLISTWIHEPEEESLQLSPKHGEQQDVQETGGDHAGIAAAERVDALDSGPRGEFQLPDDALADGQSMTQVVHSQTSDHEQRPVQSNLSTLRQIENYDRQQVSLWIAIQLAEALNHVHDRGVVHCDVKPANILLGWDGLARLLDFNVSQNLIRSSGSLSQEPIQLIGGTPAYMAPEQRAAMQACEGFEPTPVMDVFSLGAVLFEMLTGERPPVGVEDFDNQVSATLSVQQLSISKGLRSVICRAIHSRPEQRYQRATEFAEDLHAILHDQPLVHQAEPSYLESFQKWRRRHPKVSSGGAVACLGVAIILWLVSWGWMEVESRKEASALLARDQLKHDLPITVSLMSAVSEFSELSDELDHKLGRILGNLEHLSEQQTAESEPVAAFAAFAPDLSRLTSLWQTESKGNSRDHVGKRFRDFQRLSEQFLGNHSQLSDSLESFGRHYQSGEYSQAIAAAESDSERFDDYASQMLLGHCYLLTNQFQRASMLYSEALSVETDFPIARFYRGVTQLAIGDHRRAEDDFRRVLDKRPDFGAAKFNLGLALSHQGRLSESEQLYSELIDHKQHLTAAHLGRAAIRSKNGDLSGVQADIAAALETDPSDCRSLIGLCKLIAKTDLDRALSLAIKAVDRFPNHLDARQTLAHLLDAKGGREQEAIDQLSHILKMDSANASALAGRSVLLARQGRCSESLLDLDKLGELSPRDALLQYQISCGYSLVAETRAHSKVLGGSSVETFVQQDTVAGSPSGASERGALRQGDPSLNQAIYWYRQAVFSDPKICELAMTDPDVSFLRETKVFHSLNQVVLDSRNDK